VKHFCQAFCPNKVDSPVSNLNAILVFSQIKGDVYDDGASSERPQNPLARLRASSVAAMRHNLPDPLVEGYLIQVVAGTGRCEGVQVMKGVQGLVGVDA
jgi:hypothetical protein